MFLKKKEEKEKKSNNAEFLFFKFHLVQNFYSQGINPPKIS